MNEKFVQLAMMNKEHYDNHPKAHIALMAAYGAIGAVAFHKYISKITAPAQTIR